MSFSGKGQGRGYDVPILYEGGRTGGKGTTDCAPIPPQASGTLRGCQLTHYTTTPQNRSPLPSSHLLHITVCGISFHQTSSVVPSPNLSRSHPRKFAAYSVPLVNSANIFFFPHLPLVPP